MRPKGMFKVAFDLEQVADNWPPFSVERLWARKTGVVGELELVNTPFFVRGVAFGDVVRVHPDHDRREMVFDEVTARSGNSTVRIVLNDEDCRDALLELFERAGCTWEFSGAGPHLTVNIPASVDYRELRRKLVELKTSGVIGVEEAFVSTGHESQLAE